MPVSLTEKASYHLLTCCAIQYQAPRSHQDSQESSPGHQSHLAPTSEKSYSSAKTLKNNRESITGPLFYRPFNGEIINSHLMIEWGVGGGGLGKYLTHGHGVWF